MMCVVGYDVNGKHVENVKMVAIEKKHRRAGKGIRGDAAMCDRNWLSCRA
jgi:hypothetical protein